MPKIFAIWMLVMYPICFVLAWMELELEDNYLDRFVVSAFGGAVVFAVLSVIAAEAFKVLFA